MLEWVLKDNIKNALNIFYSTCEDLENDQLSAIDWRIISDIQQFLEPFYIAMIKTEGQDITIEQILLTMDFLLEKFEKAKKQFARDKFILPMVKTDWVKMDKYYNLTDHSPMYIGAIVMNPRWKFNFFQGNWPNS